MVNTAQLFYTSQKNSFMTFPCFFLLIEYQITGYVTTIQLFNIFACVYIDIESDYYSVGRDDCLYTTDSGMSRIVYWIFGPVQLARLLDDRQLDYWTLSSVQWLMSQTAIIPLIYVPGHDLNSNDLLNLDVSLSFLLCMYLE